MIWGIFFGNMGIWREIWLLEELPVQQTRGTAAKLPVFVTNAGEGWPGAGGRGTTGSTRKQKMWKLKKKKNLSGREPWRTKNTITGLISSLRTCEVQTLLKETKMAVCRKQQNARSEWKAHDATNSRMSCGRNAARPSHWLHLLSAPRKVKKKI